MDKILIIGTGGTIACKKDKNIHLDSPFKITEYCKFENVEFNCISPFFVLSENMDLDLWGKLIDCLNAVDFSKCKGVIILHGSDTLYFTASLVGNAFSDKPIVLVASDKPLEDKTANGFENFNKAVEEILKGLDTVYVSYDNFVKAEKNPILQKAAFTPKNILVINPYVGIEYNSYNLSGVDAVLHGMYHSATAPENVLEFVEKCKKKSIPFYFVTENSSADYESADGFENIIFKSTLQSEYAKLLLTK